MPAYNAEQYVVAAITSILTQTFTNFELLVIDDGSTDKTQALVAGIGDPRLHYYRNDRNLQLSATLNRGLALARGDYIARMDADDLALPHRLAVQADYLDRRPEVDLIGSGMLRFGDRRRGIVASRPVTDPHLLRWRQHFSNQIFHPTVMFRRHALERHGLQYGVIPDWAMPVHRAPGGVGHLSEDYLLFGLMALRCNVANLPDALLHYRVHEKSVSTSQAAAQLDVARQVSRLLFEQVLGAPVEPETVAACYFTRPLALSGAVLADACRLIDRAVAAHIARYAMPAASEARIRRDAALRKQVLQRGNRSAWAALRSFLAAPTMPRDAEEWRLALRICLGEGGVSELKSVRAFVLGR